ncbi:MAG: lipopolysaccharide biosynthesis protein RfbH, partial [Clostridium lundense]|nr:lipopolysaccharide biosynthesis protein RfbH [Clostridium lundense]
HKYVYSHFGYNLKLTDMQAAVGCAQLDKLEGFIERRRHNWAYLREGLARYEDRLILPEREENSDPSWFGFLITVRENAGVSRNRITAFLENRNIQTRLLFSGNIIRHPCFNGLRGTDAYRVVGSLENTDRIMSDAFWIGVYPGMTDTMSDYMIESIGAALKGETK